MIIDLDLASCNPSFDASLLCEARHLVEMGGAGSGKSYFCADKFVFTMIQESGHTLCAFRKVARTIKRSIWQLLRDRIEFWGLTSLCKFNRTDFTIRFINGSEIWCIGLDDHEKLKSITGMTRAWIEEATECTPDDLMQVNLRLRGDTPSYKQIMYSLNPISVMHHIKGRFFDDPPENAFIHKSTYRDNIHIDDEYKREIEALISQSENLYRVYGLGEWGVLEGLIFKNIRQIDEYPETFDNEFYGLDFGFKHPMPLIHVGELDGDFYATELIYETELTMKALIAEMVKIGVPKNALIQCDESRPDSIKELKDAGFYNAIACPKGKGSVDAGIVFMQAETIYTHPDNVNMNKELASYEWRTDRQGNPMDEPIKINDDAMDALRYAIWGTYGRPIMKLERLDRASIGI